MHVPVSGNLPSEHSTLVSWWFQAILFRLRTLCDDGCVNRDQLAEQIGILRSLAMYYGVPGRFRRMCELYGQFMGPGDLCFDVGAHVGNRLRVWNALGANMIALEPQPQLMRWLQRLYGRNTHITLLEQAVGAEPGAATLYISRRTPTVTTMSPQWISAVKQDPSFRQVAWDKPVQIPVTTLDELIVQYGRPAFCKIDVEGFELDVLRGLSQPVPAVSFEYIPAAIGIARDCIDRMCELGTYEFNYSPGESHRFASARWLDADEMHAVLAGMEKGSGDVYARLDSNGTWQCVTAP